MGCSPTIYNGRSYFFQCLMLYSHIDLPNAILSVIALLRPECYQRDDILEYHVKVNVFGWLGLREGKHTRV